MKKLIIYDLDGTLAESKAPLDDEMSALLTRLLEVARVAVISGGDWPQFQKQVIARLSPDSQFDQLSILPTCGTKFYEYKDTWTKLYSEDFSADEKKKIVDSLEQSVKEAGVEVKQTWGEQIEDRGSQITYSALGQQAPLDAKKTWDPDFSKRQKIKAILDRLIPECSVALGGTTSVDVTKPGIDKAYGIRKLQDVLGIGIDGMLFMGDAIFPGGNDYPAKRAGAESIKVRDPEETKRVTEGVIACLKPPTN